MQGEQVYMDAWGKTLVFVFIITLFPALFTNLGLMPVSQDEAIRGVVAQEMIQSGNYITPKIVGEYYYKKPPMYNWFIALSFKLFGSSREIPLRVTSLFFLFCYALVVFFFFRKESGDYHAVVFTAAMLTCGRILFWDSMLGLIDICFSFFVFLSFIAVYHFGSRGQYGRLFLVTYLITAAGFLLKGFPALVFQGITLAVYFFSRRQMRKLFSLEHLAGIAILVAIVGGYVYAYRTVNPGVSQLLGVLFTESAMRTPFASTITLTLLHLVTFPLEMVYHFFPGTILLILLFGFRSVRETIQSNSIARYLVLVFCANILVYWISPKIFPRYLLMLMPLLIIVLLIHYYRIREQEPGNRLVRIIEGIFRALFILLIPLTLSALLFPGIRNMHAGTVKCLFLGVVFSVILFLFQKLGNHRMLLTMIAMLFIRIGFDWFVLPIRHDGSEKTQLRQMCLRAAEVTRGKPMYLFMFNRVDYFTPYYLNAFRNDVLEIKTRKFRKGEYYLVGEEESIPRAHNILYRFRLSWHKYKLRIIELK